MSDFTGRTIFITGAASGIGLATARGVRAAGGRVIAADIGDPALTAQAAGLGNDDSAIRLDVRDAGAVAHAVAEAVARFGRIDGLVASAGISVPGAVTEMDLADWDQALAVNLTGTMLCARAVLPGMVAAGGGAIVTVASIFGMTGGQGNTPYNVSKGGVLQLTRSLAADYGAAGRAGERRQPRLYRHADDRDDPRADPQRLCRHASAAPPRPTRGSRGGHPVPVVGCRVLCHRRQHSG